MRESPEGYELRVPLFDFDRLILGLRLPASVFPFKNI